VDPTAAARLVRTEAEALGFARVGFTPVGAVERHRVYADWLARGLHGEMEYLARDADPRRDPASLLDGARTVVAVALSYAHPDGPDVPADHLGPRGAIARYARGADYHALLKERLRALAAKISGASGRAIAWRACVDTAPLLEREAAQSSGVGFIAKNTLLIAPGAGSWLLLGELLLDLDCAPDRAPEPPRCGECTRCLDACPTGAFIGAYTLDARRCISYLTIELEGAIPVELRPLVGDRVFGCDVCQDVCPFNASATGGDPQLAPRPGYSRPSLRRLLGLGAAQFRKWQARSALRRIHRPQLLRNVCVALGNVGTVDDLDALRPHLDSPYELVREHAAWAIAEIGRRHGV
jgi:epoxyqueuosine reductase